MLNINSVALLHRRIPAASVPLSYEAFTRIKNAADGNCLPHSVEDNKKVFAGNANIGFPKHYSAAETLQMKLPLYMLYLSFITGNFCLDSY